MKFFTSLLLIGVSIGLFFMYVKPTYSTITDIRQKISQHDDAIARAKKVVATRDGLISSRQSFSSKDIARLDTFMPDSADSIRLVIDVNNIALQYAQGIKNVKITNDTSSKNSSQVAGEPSLRYEPISLSFGISLSYDQFLKFSADLEKSLHLMDITSLSFAPVENSSLYDYSVTLSAYVLKSN